MKDRRNGDRVNTNFPVKYEIVEKTAVNFPVKYELVKWDESPRHPQTATIANCIDLSIHGLRFNHDLDLSDRTVKKLKKGAFKMNLEFTLPDNDKPINLLGRMVYGGEDEENEGEINKQCMGILFIDIDPDDYARISKFVQSNNSDKPLT